MKILFFRSLYVISLLASLGCLQGLAQTAPIPAWWSSGVLDTSPANPSDNWAIANVGQLKNIATKAKEHLDAKLNLTTADWNLAYANANPFPFGTNSDPDNFSPVNIGQLKFIASGFYNILKNKAPGYYVKLRLFAMGVPADSIFGSSPVYPWATNISTGGVNYSPVMIGQLKIVFSFDLSGYNPSSPALDSNQNGIPDVWEYCVFGFLVSDPLSDTYGDGLTLIVKYLSGANPTKPAQVVIFSTAINLMILTP